MPPKKTTPADSVDSSAAGAVTALCHLIMTNDDFKADTVKLAPILGIAQPKNVPRKINSIVNPYGFEFKGGKIVAHSGGQAQNVVAGSSDNATAASNDDKVEKAKKSTKAFKSNGKAQESPTKKRKLAESSLTENGRDGVKDEDDDES